MLIRCVDKMAYRRNGEGWERVQISVGDTVCGEIEDIVAAPRDRGVKLIVQDGRVIATRHEPYCEAPRPTNRVRIIGDTIMRCWTDGTARPSRALMADDVIDFADLESLLDIEVEDGRWIRVENGVVIVQ